MKNAYKFGDDERKNDLSLVEIGDLFRVEGVFDLL